MRDDVSTSGKGTTAFDLPIGDVLVNILPLALVMLAIALALRFFTQTTIKVFLAFGRGLEIVLTAALALSILEYFTNIFSTLFGSWPLAPFIADAEDQFRALEVAGYIGVMLAGAFPMVYAIRKGLAKPLGSFGRRFGVSEECMSGFLAATANVLALFRIIRVMPPKEKVLTIAYSVCAAFLIGDHLAFTANFQPALIAAVMGGKFFGGLLAIVFAVWLVLPQARKLEAEDRRTGVIETDEYLAVEPALEAVSDQKQAMPA